MSLSYSAIKNRGGTLTLPSVESWGTNNNILRDPPKSIHTRRIDKVGDTSNITGMIDDAGDRACEAIQEYARGVNPMVSVSYSNTDGSSSKLPYRIMRDGAFRPPIRRPTDLLPLSRMPRVWTSAETQKGFIDYTKSRNCAKSVEKTREVHNNIINPCGRPTAVFNLSTPISEPFEVKYVIQNPVTTSVTSGLKTMDITQQNVKVPLKGANNDLLYPFAQANVSDNRYVNNNGEFNSNKFIQDKLNTSAVSKGSATHIQLSSVEDIFDMSNVRTQNVLTTDYKTPIQGLKKQNYIHENIELSKNLPDHYARSNVRQNIHKRTKYENELKLDRTMPVTHAVSNVGNNRVNVQDEIIDRNYKLPPKITPGRFDPKGSVPMINRMQNVGEYYETNKSTMNKQVSQEFNNRYGR